jgi:hypothetical protein
VFSQQQAVRIDYSAFFQPSISSSGTLMFCFTGRCRKSVSRYGLTWFWFWFLGSCKHYAAFIHLASMAVAVREWLVVPVCAVIPSPVSMSQ